MLLPFCWFVLVLGLWILWLGLLVILQVVFGLGFDGFYFLSRGWEQVMSGRESCLLGVLSIELLIRYWSLLLALRLFLVMAVGGLFKIMRFMRMVIWDVWVCACCGACEMFLILGWVSGFMLSSYGFWKMLWVDLAGYCYEGLMVFMWVLSVLRLLGWWLKMFVWVWKIGECFRVERWGYGLHRPPILFSRYRGYFFNFCAADGETVFGFAVCFLWYVVVVSICCWSWGALAGSVVLVVIIVDVLGAIVAPAPCGSPGVCKLLRRLTVR